jgi:hypothetical protein
MQYVTSILNIEEDLELNPNLTELLTQIIEILPNLEDYQIC